MADDDPILFDERGARLIQAVVRRELSRVMNRTLREGNEPNRQNSEQWVPFVNDDTQGVPAHAIMRISTGSTYNTDVNVSYLKCTQATTVFSRLYAVNAATTVAPGDGGLCAIYGPVEILYDSTGSPVFGDSCGPKAGSWGLVKAYPKTTEVLGVVDSTQHLLYGTLQPIDRVVGQSTGAIPKNTATTNWRVYGGSTSGADTDLGLQVPSGICRTTMANGIWLEVTFPNSTPQIVPLACTT